MANIPDVTVVPALGTAEEVAESVGLEAQDQIRVATALSEIGRELLEAGRLTPVIGRSYPPTATGVAVRDHDGFHPATKKRRIRAPQRGLTFSDSLR